ncbi:acyltransferase family protein [Tunturiibacter gelidoferens]|nr:acyltransferase [Edaphobacter lichenicola]
MSRPSRLQLDFIDGLRAIAALYILFHHALQSTGYFPPALHFMGRGHDVVAIFITISGFCLALPLAQRGNWNLEATRFYRKRMRRILPPYFAAIGVALLVAAFYSYKSHPQDYLGNPLSWSMIVSHLLLVQNWIPSQLTTLDGPLWTIAVECQIYVLFPLLVLLWRYGGRWLTLAVGFVVAHGVFYATHYGGNANFLFLFVVGMLGAELAFSHQLRRWLGPATLLTVVAYLLFIQRPGSSFVIADILVALSAAFLMAYLTQHRDHWGNKVLGAKPLAWIGTFSYSLYLVHSFPEVIVERWILASKGGIFADSNRNAAILMIFVVSPIAIAASYGFHLVFERPFLTQKRKEAEQRLAARV